MSLNYIISGPAMPGRILNYIKLAYNHSLRYKKGNRNLRMVDNIGSAWCLDFMYGLNLITFIKNNTNIFDVVLTEFGNELYDCIANYDIEFYNDSKHQGLNVINVRNQLEEIGQLENVINIIYKHFPNSIVFQYLQEFLQESGKTRFNIKFFQTQYYSWVANRFNVEIVDHKNSRTKTYENRVPSLFQFLQLINLCDIDTKNNSIQFNLNNLFQQNYFSDNINNINIKNRNIISENKLINVVNSCNNQIKSSNVEKNNEISTINSINNNNISNDFLIDDYDDSQKIELVNDYLVERYGIDGNIQRLIIVRNTAIQNKFKKQLLDEFGNNCAICGKTMESILIASHIVASSESDVFGKINKNNGLLLCPIHDKLFDKHLISFDENWTLVHKNIDNVFLKKFNINKNIILNKKYWNVERKENLSKHYKILENELKNKY